MQELVTFARNVAHEAGKYTLQLYKKSSGEMGLTTKADSSPVTLADKGAEALMRQRIHERYPADTIVGEEEATITGTSGRTWYLDPIDGTKSFIHGVPFYSNLVALWDEQGPLISVINLPALNTMMWAVRGEGCWYDDQGEVVRAHASTTARFDGSLAVMTSGFEWLTVEQHHQFFALPGMKRTWGDGYGYYLVARGDADVMVDYGVSIWDMAPMHLIITESGATFWERTEEGQTDVIAAASPIFSQVKAVLHPDA